MRRESSEKELLASYLIPSVLHMKIFSNFDTKLRQNTFQDYQQKYGVENVLCFWRSRLYRWIKFFLNFLIYTTVAVVALIFFYRRLGGEYFWYVIITVIVIYVAAMFPVIGKYIDYKMDFIVVIPNSIMMYEQWWILKRNVSTISTQSIKSIAIKKSGLLYSIFDNGDIIILTEWDTERNGEIKLRWIPRPEKRRNQIVKVVGIDLEANQNPKI